MVPDRSHRRDICLSSNNGKAAKGYLSKLPEFLFNSFCLRAFLNYPLNSNKIMCIYNVELFYIFCVKFYNVIKICYLSIYINGHYYIIEHVFRVFLEFTPKGAYKRAKPRTPTSLI